MVQNLVKLVYTLTVSNFVAEVASSVTHGTLPKGSGRTQSGIGPGNSWLNQVRVAQSRIAYPQLRVTEDAAHSLMRPPRNCKAQFIENEPCRNLALCDKVSGPQLLIRGV